MLVYCPTETTVAECIEIKARGTGSERDYLDAIKDLVQHLGDPKSHILRKDGPKTRQRLSNAFAAAEHLFVIAYGNYRIEVRQLEFEQDPYYSAEYGTSNNNTDDDGDDLDDLEIEPINTAPESEFGPDDDDDEINK